MACSNCFRGGVTVSKATGEETIIHGLQTYVAHPDDDAPPRGIIIFITDAFGWDFVNNRVLCDQYAKKGGFLVYCPDFMAGTSLNPKTIGLMDKLMNPASWLTTIFFKPFYVLQVLIIGLPWMIKSRISATNPRVVSFLQAIRTNPPPYPTKNLKIGLAGFCWGGKHTMLLAADAPSSRVIRTHESLPDSGAPKPLIDCAFTAHPSYIKVPEDIEAITIPTSVAIGDEDMAMGAKPIVRMKETLEGQKNSDHEVNIIPGAKHGFAVRTHPDDAEEMACAEKAENQAIAWFTRWLV